MFLGDSFHKVCSSSVFCGVVGVMCVQEFVEYTRKRVQIETEFEILLRVRYIQVDVKFPNTYLFDRINSSRCGGRAGVS